MPDPFEYETVINTIIEPRIGHIFIPHLKYHGVPVEGIEVDRIDHVVRFKIEGRWTRENGAASREEEIT